MGKRRAIWLGGAGAVILPWLVSCSLWGSGPGVRVQIDPKLIGTRAPESRTEYSCYVVNVYGSGISPTVGESALGFYAPDCLKLGVSSQMVSGDVLAKAGVRFSLPAGSGRTIQILGIVTSLGSQCENQPISKLFENGKKPELYELAARKTDLFVDTKVSFKMADVIAAPQNLMASCASKKTDYEVEDITSVHIVTMNSDADQELETFTLNSDGTLTKQQSLDVTPFSPSHTLQARDASRAVYWELINGNALTYNMAQPGLLVPGASTDTGNRALSGKNNAAFSDDSMYFFAATNSNSAVAQLFYDPTFKSYDPPNISTDAYEMQKFWVWENEFHYVSVSSNGLQLQSLVTPFPAGKNAFSSDPVGVPSGIDLFDSGLGAVVVNRNKGIYMTHVYGGDSVPIYKLAYYRRVNNRLVEQAPTYSLAPDAGPTMRTAFDPTGKFLFARYEIEGAQRITSFLLDPDTGNILSQSSLAEPAQFVNDFVVDHRGKFLVIGASEGSSSLKVCEISAAGLLINCVTKSDSVASGLMRVQSFPLF